MDYSVHVLRADESAPGVLRIVVERPNGYDARPGEAADLAVDEDGWWDQPRPLHFRRTDDPETLEFTLRLYAEADPVARRLAGLEPGDRLTLSAPWSENTPDVFFGGWRRPAAVAAGAADEARRETVVAAAA